MGQVRVVGNDGAPLLASRSASEAMDVSMSVHQPILMSVPGAAVDAKPNVATPFGLFDSGVDDLVVLLTCYPHCVHSLRHSATTFVFDSNKAASASLFTIKGCSNIGPSKINS